MENAPDDLRKFADIVVLLGNIPGASQYAGPVLEVAEVLKSKAAEAPSAGRLEGEAALGREGRRHGRRRGRCGRELGAIPMRSRQAGHVTVSAVPQTFPDRRQLKLPVSDN